MFSKDGSGFTLIELLLVIAIIAILVAITVPVVFNARREAYVANARQGISDVATAIEHFFQEYGRLPNSEEGNDDDRVDGIIESLAGADSEDNPRELAFLNVMETDEQDWEGEFFDPWDSRYLIFLDDGVNESGDAYDRVIGFDGAHVTNELAVVISRGLDRVLHTKDDLLSVPRPKDWNQN